MVLSELCACSRMKARDAATRVSDDVMRSRRAWFLDDRRARAGASMRWSAANPLPLRSQQRSRALQWRGFARGSGGCDGPVALETGG